MTRDLSLGELQALCVKATRGAGRAVGVAEDAGRAVRWLCARGHDGAGALIQLLQATDGQGAAELSPVVPVYAPAGVAICPLALGGYLSDMGEVPEGPLGPVWSPLLMLPFLADVCGTGLDIERDTGGDPAVIRLVRRAHVGAAVQSRADVDPATFNALLAFAARTYAPATEQSRAGAGSGLSDND